MSPADLPPAELLLIRLEVITGGLHDWAAKGISSSGAALTEPNNRGFPRLIFSGLPDSPLPPHRALSFTLTCTLHTSSAHSSCMHACTYVHVYCTYARKRESLSPVSAFDSASNKRRTWFLLFFFFSKLGHELYSAASNYQPSGKIQRGRVGEEQARNQVMETG